MANIAPWLNTPSPRGEWERLPRRTRAMARHQMLAHLRSEEVDLRERFAVIGLSPQLADWAKTQCEQRRELDKLRKANAAPPDALVVLLFSGWLFSLGWVALELFVLPDPGRPLVLVSAFVFLHLTQMLARALVNWWPSRSCRSGLPAG